MAASVGASVCLYHCVSIAGCALLEKLLIGIVVLQIVVFMSSISCILAHNFVLYVVLFWGT